MKNNSSKLYLLAACGVFVLVASFCAFQYFKTKARIAAVYAAGTEADAGFSQVLETLLNDGKTGTLDENVKAANAKPDKGVIEIKEKMFIAQTNDLYLNASDYMGKTVKLEGLFKKEQYGDKEVCFVVRYGPGCCGYDGTAGFEVAWDTPAKGKKAAPFNDDWVKAVGVLSRYDAYGQSYLYLSLSSLDILPNRGNEYVSQ